MKKWGSIVGAALASAVVISLGTMVLEAFFSRVGVSESWPAAITSVSTMVLVIVTTVYMVFTGVLVKLQGQANSNVHRLEQARTVRRAMDMVYPILQKLRSVEKDYYPLDESTPPDVDGLTFLADDSELTQMAESLRAISSQMPPELAPDTVAGGTKILRAIRANTVLRTCILKAATDVLRQENEKMEARLEALESKAKSLSRDEQPKLPAAASRQLASSAPSKKSELPPVSWEQIRAKFYEQEDFRRDAGTDGALAEWPSMRDGHYIKAAIEAISELESRYRDFLWKE